MDPLLQAEVVNKAVGNKAVVNQEVVNQAVGRQAPTPTWCRQGLLGAILLTALTTTPRRRCPHQPPQAGYRHKETVHLWT